MEAIEKYGAARGAVLATYRILRCNPWGGHGFDPPRWFGEKMEENAPVAGDVNEATSLPQSR